MPPDARHGPPSGSEKPGSRGTKIASSHHPMNTASSRATTTLMELAAWCRFSHDLLTAGSPASVPEGVHAMKRQLARVHRRHLGQLREWLPGLERRQPEGTGQRAWTEIAAALQATDERVVRAACALLHRAVTAAYDRAASQAQGDQDLARLVAQQKAEVVQGFRDALMAQPVRSEGLLQPVPVRDFVGTLAS